MVTLAMGFVHVNHEGLIRDTKLKLDQKGNVVVNNYQTSDPQIFAAGDTIDGPSLVVHAINSGRQAAEVIDQWFKKRT